MITTQLLSYIAQATSFLATLMGVGALAYLVRVVRHLDESSFKKIFSLLGIFLGVTLIGVASMAAYHVLDSTAAEELAEGTELIWYVFIFVSLIVSIHGSFTASAFGKTMSRIKKVVRKSFKYKK